MEYAITEETKEELETMLFICTYSSSQLFGISLSAGLSRASEVMNIVGAAPRIRKEVEDRRIAKCG